MTKKMIGGTQTTQAADKTPNNTNMVAAGYTDRCDDRRNDRRDNRRNNSRGGSGGSRSSWRDCPPRVPDLPAAEQLNAPLLHTRLHRLKRQRQEVDSPAQGLSAVP
jgi:hypothetical protein